MVSYGKRLERSKLEDILFSLKWITLFTCKAFLPALSFQREFLKFRFWSILIWKKERLKSRTLHKARLVCWVFSWQNVTPVSWMGFPARDETCCLLQRCSTLCSCLWGQTVPTLHGVMLYHPDFSSQLGALSKLFLSTEEVQRFPDVSWCVVFNCQANLASYLTSPSEGCMLSSALHYVICSLKI